MREVKSCSVDDDVTSNVVVVALEKSALPATFNKPPTETFPPASIVVVAVPPKYARVAENILDDAFVKD